MRTTAGRNPRSNHKTNKKVPGTAGKKGKPFGFGFFG